MRGLGQTRDQNNGIIKTFEDAAYLLLIFEDLV